MRGATCPSSCGASDCRNFNPRSSCEERPGLSFGQAIEAMISIHAPHARSDLVVFGWEDVVVISIHAPHARSDHSCNGLTLQGRNFNPRSSCEERLQHIPSHPPHPDISIHAPHARSDNSRYRLRHQALISIHAPHARSDRREPAYIHVGGRFQSTLLMRGATGMALPCLHVGRYISIHAPHARSDTTPIFTTMHKAYFNPRSSCEERHDVDAIGADVIEFQSTLLMRGATKRVG